MATLPMPSTYDTPIASFMPSFSEWAMPGRIIVTGVSANTAQQEFVWPADVKFFSGNELEERMSKAGPSDFKEIEGVRLDSSFSVLFGEHGFSTMIDITVDVLRNHGLNDASEASAGERQVEGASDASYIEFSFTPFGDFEPAKLKLDIVAHEGQSVVWDICYDDANLEITDRGTGVYRMPTDKSGIN